MHDLKKTISWIVVVIAAFIIISNVQSDPTVGGMYEVPDSWYWDGAPNGDK